VCDVRGETIVLKGNLTPDPEELARVEDLAEACFPTRFFGAKVTAFSKTYPLAWIEKAVLEASCWSQPPRTWKPVWNLLQGWAKAGGPPEAPEPAPASAARTYDPHSPHGARQAEWDRDMELMKQRIARSKVHASA
jgi:hypothetical protein